MKKVNFIMSLSPEKQYAIKRWFWVTFFLCLCSVIISAYFMAPQLLTYRALHKEISILREKTKEYSSGVKNRDALKVEHELIRARTKKIDDYNESPKNPHQYMAAIIASCGDGAVLEAVRFNKKECELTILCPTSEHATVFIKRLSASELFTGVKLVSLQHDTQTKKFRCVIKSLMQKT
jgi:Tfp pilus assembly protein PilN